MNERDDARLRVATGVIAAILVAHFRVGDPSWLGPAFALSDAAEALVAAGVIQLDAITRDSHRASEVFDSIRAEDPIFEQEPVDMNSVALAVLRDLQENLKGHGVTTRSELTSELPLIMGDRRQLQEVLHNLVQNAIDAMDINKDGSRVLTVTTERQDRDTIIVAVQDTRRGIEFRKNWTAYLMRSLRRNRKDWDWD